MISKFLHYLVHHFKGGVFDNNQFKTNYRFGLLNDLGWEIYPRGLYDLMISVDKKWDMPVLISENGMAEATDRLRAHYIVSHLNEIVNAINDGVNVLGYMVLGIY